MMDYLLTFFLVILVFAVLFIALQAYVFVTGIRTVKSVNRAANAYADTRKAMPMAPHSDTVLVDVRATLLDRNTGGVIAEEIFIKKFPFRDFVDDSEGNMGGVRVVLGHVFNDGSGPRCSGSFDAVYRKDLFYGVCDALEQDGWHSNTRHTPEEEYPYPGGPDAPVRPEIKTAHIAIILLITLFLVALLMVMV